MELGYTKKLFILPFDHRATFAKELFNLPLIKDLDYEERHLIKEFKTLIYKGFKKAVEKGVPREFAAVLVDEEFGGEVLIDAKHNGFIVLLTIEKSGEDEFKFQYENFKEHIERFRPDFVKVLIKFNPEDREDVRSRQKENLKIVSDYCHQNSFKFLLELLVIPTMKQSEKFKSREDYDSKIRPQLTVDVVQELHQFGIETDVWKLEGFDREEDYQKVINAIKENGRDNVNLVVLGRGASEEKVDKWLEIGAKVDGVIGFAVGRTVFWNAIEKFYKQEIGKAEVIEKIADNFLKFYKIFAKEK